MVNPQNRPGVRPDGILIVAEVCFIGRPDFAKDGAACLHHLGHAERAPDFDKLAARDDHFFAPGQGVEDDHGRRGVIIDDRGRLGSRQFAEDLADMGVPLATASGFEVQGKGAIAPGGLEDRFLGGSRQDGPAQSGVHDDPGGVYGAAEGRGELLGEAPLHFIDETIRHEIGFRQGGGLFIENRAPDILENPLGRFQDFFPAEFFYELLFLGFLD